MKILVTGFNPFGSEKINSSIEAVKALKDKILDAEIIKLEIPTVYMKSIKKIDAAIKKYDPDIILSIGQAGGRADISIERIGINIDDYRIKDNEGNQPIDTKIYDDGENAYFSNLPIKAIVENIRKNNIPASISNTAGTFVCNHVLYGVQYLLDKKYPNKKSGFIHIPFLPEQVISRPNTPSMSISTIVKALTLALEAIIENDSDKKISGGTIC